MDFLIMMKLCEKHHNMWEKDTNYQEGAARRKTTSSGGSGSSFAAFILRVDMKEAGATSQWRLELTSLGDRMKLCDKKMMKIRDVCHLVYDVQYYYGQYTMNRDYMDCSVLCGASYFRNA